MPELRKGGGFLVEPTMWLSSAILATSSPGVTARTRRTRGQSVTPP